MGLRGVNVAAPNPPLHLSLGRVGGQEDRLRIVHDDDVARQVQAFGILLVHLVVQLEVAGPQRDRQPLQAVVNRFGDAIKVGRAR